jgi:hypothetical protein
MADSRRWASARRRVLAAVDGAVAKDAKGAKRNYGLALPPAICRRQRALINEFFLATLGALGALGGQISEGVMSATRKSRAVVGRSAGRGSRGG